MDPSPWDLESGRSLWWLNQAQTLANWVARQRTSMLPEGLWPLCPEGLWPAAKGTARARVWRLATRGRSRRTRLLRRSSTAPSPTRAHPRVRRPGFARAAWPPPLHGHTGRVRSGVSGSFVHVPATHRSIARGTRRLDRSTHGPQRRALSYSAAFRAVRWSTLRYRASLQVARRSAPASCSMLALNGLRGVCGSSAVAFAAASFAEPDRCSNSSRCMACAAYANAHKECGVKTRCRR